METIAPRPLPLGSKDSYFKAFGPKDQTIKGFWAILSLRVKCSTFIWVPKFLIIGSTQKICV